jgi:hypothetical protein
MEHFPYISAVDEHNEYRSEEMLRADNLMGQVRKL